MEIPASAHRYAAPNSALGREGDAPEEDIPLPPTEPDVKVSRHLALRTRISASCARVISVPLWRASWQERQSTVRLRRRAAATCCQRYRLVDQEGRHRVRAANLARRVCSECHH